MKRWSELPSETKDVWVEKMKLGDVVGKEICITGFDVCNSRYTDRDNADKEYIKICFTLNEQRHFTNTSSMLLRKQLQSCKNDLPILATIVKKDNWYSLS